MAGFWRIARRAGPGPAFIAPPGVIAVFAVIAIALAPAPAAAQAATAPPKPLCSTLPAAEQATARQAGLCVDLAKARIVPASAIVPLSATAAAAAAAATRNASAATARPAASMVPLTPLKPPSPLTPAVPPTKINPDTACRYKLPSYAGQPYATVAKALPLRRIQVTREARPSSRPFDEILAQRLEPVDPPLCRLVLTVSDGTLVIVPPLRGLPADQARGALAQAGLVYRPHVGAYDAAPGEVADAKPREGTEVPRGSAIDVLVAQAIERIPVPDVRGEPESEADARLDRFRVTRDEVPGAQPAGHVEDQDPRAPATAVPGAVVRLSISDGSRTPLPDLCHLPVARARALVAQRGWQLEATEAASTWPMGQVTCEDAAQRPVRRGSTVAVTVSSGVEVPDVTRMPLSQAIALAKDFRVEPARQADARPAEEVIAQDPLPQARASAGSVLRVTVSDGTLAVAPEPRGPEPRAPEPGVPASPGVPGWAWMVGAAGVLSACGVGYAIGRGRKGAAPGAGSGPTPTPPPPPPSGPPVPPVRFQCVAGVQTDMAGTRAEGGRRSGPDVTLRAGVEIGDVRPATPDGRGR